MEWDLILAMTEEDPQKRPSANEIADKYLPRWREQMREEDEKNLSASKSQPEVAATRVNKKNKESLEEEEKYIKNP